MAAFTPEDPHDRQRFDAHMSRVMKSPENTNRAITWKGDLVGSIASFLVEGQTEVTYWVDRAVWGRAIATQALALFLEVVRTRRPSRPELRATTPARSGCLRRPDSPSSTSKCPSRRDVEPESRRRSCGWARASRHLLIGHRQGFDSAGDPHGRAAVRESRSSRGAAP